MVQMAILSKSSLSLASAVAEHGLELTGLIKRRRNATEIAILVDCVHTMRAHVENGEKCDGSKI